MIERWDDFYFDGQRYPLDHLSSFGFVANSFRFSCVYAVRRLKRNTHILF